MRFDFGRIVREHGAAPIEEGLVGLSHERRIEEPFCIISDGRD